MGAHNVRAIDIDSDGDIDIYAASYLDNTIAWYENDGSQNFTKIIVDNNAMGAHDITLADFNLNGSIDIAGALFKSNSVVIYENISKRKFNKIIISNNEIGAHALTNVDIDNDGDIDIISASKNGNHLSWHENKTKSLKIEKTQPAGDFLLYDNFPNPFNMQTMISFDSGQTEELYLTIYDLKGAIIKQFYFKSNFNGKKSIIWDGKNNNNEISPAGIYIFSLISEHNIQQKK